MHGATNLVAPADGVPGGREKHGEPLRALCALLAGGVDDRDVDVVGGMSTQGVDAPRCEGAEEVVDETDGATELVLGGHGRRSCQSGAGGAKQSRSGLAPCRSYRGGIRPEVELVGERSDLSEEGEYVAL